MIAKKHKLSRLDVESVKKNHQTVRGGLGVYTYQVVSQSHNQFAVVVSKKIHKRAVIRNKIRRRVYRALTEKVEKNNQAVRVILYCSKKSLTMMQSETNKDIEEMCKKIC